MEHYHLYTGFASSHISGSFSVCFIDCFIVCLIVRFIVRFIVCFMVCFTVCLIVSLFVLLFAFTPALIRTHADCNFYSKMAGLICLMFRVHQFLSSGKCTGLKSDTPIADNFFKRI